MDRSSTLFQRGNIGTLSLGNRLNMPAMGNTLSDEEGR
jgi:2,4-dienoyl-CoA reductase-like NADH-dependent reductase (Old Yellow Enzyme family)